MALLDILGGRRDGAQPASERLRNPALESQPTATGSFAERVEQFVKPSATAGGGPSMKGVVGALLTGGLMDLVAQFRGAGKADTIDSWISCGANQPVSPNDLSKVLTDEQIAFLTERTGMLREELLAGLSDRLPQVVDQLTPDGRVPTTDEIQCSL